MTGHWQIPFLSTTTWRMIFCLVTATLLIACSALPNASGTTLVSSRHPNKSLLTLVSRYLQASSHGAFCSKWRSCQEPFHCDLFMGSGDFGLGVCKQQAPLGKPCGTDKFMCASGGVCKTGYGGTLCRSVVPAGGVCTDPRATLCEDKLECQKGKCVKSVGYAVACTSTYTQCRPGLVCDKICKVHVSLGGYCGYDNSVCHDGLTCYGEGYHGKFCSRFLGHNQVCNGEHVHCNTGFKCVKAGSVNRCVAGLSKGHVCGTESRYCLPELTCHAWGNSKRCVAIMDRDQDCSGSFMLCKGAARCVGESGQKRCRVAKNKGEDCSLDRNGYAFCGYGLRCYKYAGAGKCFQQMKENGDCSGQYMACHAGFHCVGDPGKQQCRKALPQGSSCVSPYNKCDHNLICHGEGAEAFCYAVVGYKGDCSAKYVACQAGLECRGPDTKKLCLRPLAKGGVCDGIYRFCGTGLECTLIGKGKRCASIMGEGGDCSRPYMLCKPGLACVGRTREDRQCWPKRTFGQTCDDQYQHCDHKFSCYKGHCSMHVGLYGDCGNQHQYCKTSLVCAASGTEQKCVKPGGKGAQCARAFVICEKGLTCYGEGNERRCAAVMDENGSCEGPFMHCKAGFECVGPAGAKQCKTLSKKGELCGVPYFYCRKNLLCLADKHLHGKGKCVGVSEAYDRCDGTFAENMVCGPGLKCQGYTVKKCTATPQLGGKCGNYHGKCESGQFCLKENDGEFGICYKSLEMGEKCEGKYSKCKHGLLCAGIPSIKECRKPMRLNTRCDDPFWVCASGLRCEKLPGKHYEWCIE